MGVIVVILFACAVIGALVGERRGHGGAGFLLGVLLGPIGILIVAVMERTPEAEVTRNEQIAAASGTRVAASSSTLRACPWCAEQIQQSAIVCRHCNRDVETGQPA